MFTTPSCVPGAHELAALHHAAGQQLVVARGRLVHDLAVLHRDERQRAVRARHHHALARGAVVEVRDVVLVLLERLHRRLPGNRVPQLPITTCTRCHLHDSILVSREKGLVVHAEDARNLRRVHHFVVTAPELLSYPLSIFGMVAFNREKERAPVLASAEEFCRIWVKRHAAYFRVIDANGSHQRVLLVVEGVSIPSAMLRAPNISTDPSTIATAMRLEHLESEMSMICK